MLRHQIQQHLKSNGFKFITDSVCSFNNLVTGEELGISEEIIAISMEKTVRVRDNNFIVTAWIHDNQLRLWIRGDDCYLGEFELAYENAEKVKTVLKTLNSLLPACIEQRIKDGIINLDGFTFIEKCLSSFFSKKEK